MNYNFLFSKLPVNVISERTGVDNLLGSPNTLHLDLGKPGDSPRLDPETILSKVTGPRISCYRTKNKKGWRIVLHADDGDPFAAHTITDDGTITTETENL